MEKSTFSQRLAEAMRIRAVTQTELCKRTGIGKSSISTYLRGGYKAKQDKVDLLSLALGVDPAWLMGYAVPMKSNVAPEITRLKNVVPVEKRAVPVIGTIAAGTPILADEHIECYVPCEDGCNADFGLRVQGDSMINAEIYDGDIIFIRQQPDVDDGQIAAVRIDDSATLKRLYHINGGVMLQAENAAYAPMVFTAENCDDIQVIGLAVAKYSKIRH